MGPTVADMWPAALWAARAPRQLAWAAAYAVLAFGPAALMTFFLPSGTSAVTASADALGLMGLGILGLQLLLPARWGPLTSSFGADRLIGLHRSLASTGTLFVLLHVVLLMVDDPARLQLLEFWSAPTRARLAVAATLALAALSITSLLRTRLRLSYEGWRRLHLALGLVLVVGGAAHALLVGHYLAAGLLRDLTIALLGVSLAGVLFLRIGRPLSVARRFVVEEVAEESGGAFTVHLRADGHAGVAFAPGQFAWLKDAGRPLGLVEHPFSFASSAHRPDRPAFTVRPVGDFTGTTLRALRGRRVLLDGPHGGWHPRHPERGVVLLVAGIGITPAMSVLRTFDDEEGSPPVTLVYASRDPESVVFADELEGLAQRLPLRIVHLPGRDEGPRRRLDATLLQEVLGAGRRRLDVLICGSPAFTASALAATEQLRIPRHYVHAEALGFA
jgi:3-phenylpropionate/trans-cinnamate dioxygenase ferredoxin reductase subunit